MSPVGPPAVPPLPRWRELLWILLVLLGTVWVLVVPLLGLQASLLMVPLFRAPYPAELAEAHHLLAITLGVGVATVVVGFALSVLARSNGAGWFFALLLLPTLLLALLWLGSWQDGRPAPAPEPRPSIGCQEHSGGDTRCPGG